MARPRTKNKHLPKFVTVIHGSYWYRAPKQKPIRIGPEGEDATLYKFMAERAEPAGPIVTMRDLFDRYEREVLPTLGERTQVDYRSHLKLLRAVFGEMRPDDVKPKHVGQFLDVDKGKISRNRITAVLSAVFTKAVGRWYAADRNPCIGVERNPSKPRERLATDAEFAAVYAIMPPRLQIAMELALLTGQRQGDLLKLKWDHVSPEGVLFRQGKTKKGRLIQLSPDLETALLRAKKLLPMLPREYVLRTEKGKRYTSSGFRGMWQRYIRRATKGYTKGGKFYPPVLVERFTFHDIRAKNVSDEADINVANLRAGHSTMSMTKRVYDRGVRTVTPLNKKQKP